MNNKKFFLLGSALLALTVAACNGPDYSTNEQVDNRLEEYDNSTGDNVPVLDPGQTEQEVNK